MRRKVWGTIAVPHTYYKLFFMTKDDVSLVNFIRTDCLCVFSE